MTPTCWIIAGPNGAGKTTFALDYLPQVADCQRFINADLIAAGLAPLAPESQLPTASRLYLQEIRQATREQRDFAFETTLAGVGYLKLITDLQAKGWRVELIYLALSSVEFSQARVCERVAHGGHNIPTADIIRRFPRSLSNLRNRYAPLADRTLCYLNDGPVPRLIFTQRKGHCATVVDADSFAMLFQGLVP